MLPHYSTPEEAVRRQQYGFTQPFKFRTALNWRTREIPPLLPEQSGDWWYELWGLHIVRLNRCTFQCLSDQTVSGISTIKISANIKHSFQVISQGHSIPLPLSFTICPDSHRHMLSYLHQTHFLCLTKRPNQLQTCVAQRTVKSHWSKISLHTCKTSDFAFSMENLARWVKLEHLLYGQHPLGWSGFMCLVKAHNISGYQP